MIRTPDTWDHGLEIAWHTDTWRCLTTTTTTATPPGDCRRSRRSTPRPWFVLKDCGPAQGLTPLLGSKTIEYWTLTKNGPGTDC